MEKLYINNASYFVEDRHGSRILVKVNYWDGKFSLRVENKKDDNIEELKKEAMALAKDLINRKSRVNFAK